MNKKCRLGKHERAARKKRKRGWIDFYDQSISERRTLKLGRKKYLSLCRKQAIPF